VADLDRLQVDAYVDETDIGQVRVGQPATVTVDAYPNRPFRGRVAKIASGSTMQQNVVTYDVTIALEDSGHLLKPDMTATANIVVARRDHVLTVPVDALKNSAHGATVAAMSGGPGGKPEFTTVSVRTGISDGDRTEIISGLQDGDSVVVSGQTSQMADRRREGPPVPGPFGLGGPPGPPPGGGGGGGRGRG
jgi:RND family efflux transporter MFP subunit